MQTMYGNRTGGKILSVKIFFLEKRINFRNFPSNYWYCKLEKEGEFMGKAEDRVLEIYHLYSDQVYRYIFLLVGDVQHAEDLTQETFIRALKSIDRFLGNASDKTWLFAIARNITIDFHRKRKVLVLLSDWIKDRVPSKDSLPEDIVNLGEETEQVYTALKKLKRPYQDVIILRKLKEFSIIETAQVLNWSEGKVKSTQLRALEALKKELLKEGYVYEAK